MTKTFRKGFTLVELSLSLIFIGTLSIMVALVVSNTVASYQRGMTLNQVNTVAMDLVDDMRSAIQNSSADGVSSLCVDYYPETTDATNPQRTKCLEDGADSFTRVVRSGVVKLTDTTQTSEAVPLYGAFCTGTYSYLWNSGYYFNSDLKDDGYAERGVSVPPAILRYRYKKEDDATVVVATTDLTEPFRLLKVRDEARAVCVAKMRQVNATVNPAIADTSYLGHEDLINELPGTPDANLFDISGGMYPVLAEQPQELLDADKYNDLVLYSLSSAQPAESSTAENMFYAVSFILGTIRGGIDITAKGNNCTPPEGYGRADFDYCAINRFNFAAQAIGKITR